MRSSRLVVALTAFLTCAGALAQSEELAADTINATVVEITVQNGQPHVVISGEQIEIPQQKLQQFEQFLSRKMTGASLLRDANFEVKLRGVQARAIIEALQSSMMLSDEEAMAALENGWDSVRASLESEKSGLGGGDNGHERVIIGKEFHIDAEEKLGDVVLIGSSGVIEGEVTNLVSIASSVELTSTARVTKQLVVLGSQIEKRPGATVKADEVNVFFPASTKIQELVNWVRQNLVFTWTDNMKWAAWSFVLALIFGLIYLRFVPQFNQNAVEYSRSQTFFSFVIGLMAQLFFFPTALMLIATIIGILFLPIYIMVFALVWVIGYVVGACLIASHIPLAAKISKNKALIIGLALVGLVRLVPYVGFMLMLLITTVGFGAVIRTMIFGARRP